MHLKQYRSRNVRVPDPLRPGRHVLEERFIDTGASGISHGDKTFKPDGNGWIEVPMEVGEHLMKFRGPRGERFMTPEEVGEHVGFGAIDSADMPEKQEAQTKRTRRVSTVSE